MKEHKKEKEELKEDIPRQKEVTASWEKDVNGTNIN